VPSNISPNPSELISEVSEPYDKPSWDIFEIRPFSGQNRVNWGGRGGPRISFFIGIFLFVLLGSPSKNLKSYDTSFLGLSNGTGSVWL